ncbi:MAG TPA: formyltransferase family protein [Longimicrobium sp.]|nr:formyltransferase family protein [Longimicrobium sp.]
MKILFLSQEESLFLAPMLDRVFRELKGHPIEVMLLRDLRVPRLARFVELARRVGPSYTFRTGIDYALRMLGTMAERRGVRLFRTPPSIAAAARRHGMPVHERFEKLNAPATVDFIRSLAPDLVVSVACPQILRPAVLGIPPLGCVNVHGSRLPRYRGMHSAFWQLFHGETDCATTVHFMNEGVDAGPILRQEPWRIEPRDTLHDVIRKSKSAGAVALVEVIREMEAGRPETRENPDAGATRFTEPTREEVREFRRRGKALR